MSPTHTVRPSGSKHLDTTLEKTEEDEEDEEEEEDVEDLRRLFSSPPSSSSSSPPACTSFPSALRGGVVGEEEEGHLGSNKEKEEEGGGVGGEGEEESGSALGGRSKVSVELHSEGQESREEERGGSTTCLSSPPSPCSASFSSVETSCVSSETLASQEWGTGGGGVVDEGGGAVLEVGVRAGPKAGLGGDTRVLCFGGDEEEEEQGPWLSSVRYLCGLRRTLGGRGVWELELTAPLRCWRRVKWTFWLCFCIAAARVTALLRSWFWL